MLFFFISAGNAEPSRDEAALESFVAAAQGDTKQGTVWGKIRELKQINVSGEKPVINEQGLNKHEEYELASIPGGCGGGGGGDSTKSYTGRLCPQVQTLTLLYTMEPRSTDTRLIRTLGYYGQFRLSR